jgi:hypothetical protein
MNPVAPTKRVRFLPKIPLLPRSIPISVGASVAALLSLNVAHATFHLWVVTELYTSGDGSVQFMKLTNAFTSENFLAGHTIVCSSPLATNIYTFPSNLTSTATANKSLLIGTPNLASVPGGLTPDYVLTNSTPFLFINGGGPTTVGIVGSAQPSAVYTNLPTDGQSSLTGMGGTMSVTTNSLMNFSGLSNSIVPARFAAPVHSQTNILLKFATATGPNGTAGPNYEVQSNADLGSKNWATFTNILGDGATKTVATPINTPARFFRLKVP